jgi:glycosyltransferase involved in cell wall biosynthesis
MMAPTLSIGMPVFNGAKYLQEAIDSLLTQTFADFELIISDNGSTDSTREICLENERKDSRIRYVRQSRNIGGPRNWNFVAEEARGRYFKWASANDLHDHRFIERCLSILDDDRGIVLCYADTMLIDEHGASIREYLDPLDLTQNEPFDRFKSYVLYYRNQLNNAQAGVIRTAALHRTRLEGIYPSGDLPLMAELAWYGKYHRIAEPLFYRRMTPDTATGQKSADAVNRFVRPDIEGDFVWRHWPVWFDLLRAGLRAPTSLRDGVRAAYFVLKAMHWRRAELKGEVRSALGHWRESKR